MRRSRVRRSKKKSKKSREKISSHLKQRFPVSVSLLQTQLSGGTHHKKNKMRDLGEGGGDIRGQLIILRIRTIVMKSSKRRLP